MNYHNVLITLLNIKFSGQVNLKWIKDHFHPDKNNYIPYTDIRLPTIPRPSDINKLDYLEKLKKLSKKLLYPNPDESKPMAETLPDIDDELTPDSPSKDTDEKMVDGTKGQEELEDSDTTCEEESKPTVHLPKDHPCCVKNENNSKKSKSSSSSWSRSWSSSWSKS